MSISTGLYSGHMAARLRESDLNCAYRCRGRYPSFGGIFYAAAGTAAFGLLVWGCLLMICTGNAGLENKGDGIIVLFHE